ncbi:MAG: alpha/beta hydrolase [Myxococcaceae bacterium]
MCLAMLLAASPELTVSHRRVTTPDGVALAVYRYERPGPKVSVPVLLVPDVGFTRAAYDFEGRGLARSLAESGRAVFVVELRGQGKAGPGVSLEAMARDLDGVLDALEVKRVDLVVHGWAGSVVLAVNSDDPRIRRVIAFNTPLLAEVPSTLAENFLLDGGRFSTLASTPAGAHVFELLFSMWSKFPTGTDRAFLATGTRDLSKPIAAELLTWMRSGDLPLASGSVVERLTAWKKPTLLLVGLADGFASPELCAVWRERAGGSVKLRSFSRLETREDFSHLSLLLGSNAPAIVFPLVHDFLSSETP